MSAHSGCSTDSAGPPSRVRGSPAVPSGPSGATRSSVPSHGIRGWSQATQASSRPSGDGRGKARKSLPETSSRTADGSPAPAPSSGTATSARWIRPSACASRTHHTSRPSGAGTGSAYRQAAGSAGSGVSGTGASEPGSSRYSRWSDHDEKTSPVPAGVGTGSQHSPPYSCTRVRAFQPAGRTSAIRPAPSRRTTANRPPSSGRPSDHHTSSPTGCTNCTARSPPATSVAPMGDGHAPYGATIRSGIPPSSWTARPVPD